MHSIVFGFDSILNLMINISLDCSQDGRFLP
jgi:hypothetical protein